MHILPNSSVLVPITFTHPSKLPSVLGASTYSVTAEFPINSDDPVAGLQIFTFTGTVSFNPLPPPFDTWKYVDCYQYSGTRILPNGMTNGQSSVMTPQLCIQNCWNSARKYPVAGLEYAGECWCGAALPVTGAGSSKCNLACRGNKTALCGGAGALNVYMNPAVLTTTALATSIDPTITTSSTVATTTVDPTATTGVVITPTITSVIDTVSTVSSSTLTTLPSTTVMSTTLTTSTTSSTTSTPTSGWRYIGCTSLFHVFFPGNMIGTGRTPSTCQAGCLAAGKGWTFAGVEYGGECWCGSDISKRVEAIESTCNIPCKADTSFICGGRSRMSLYGFAS
ncbi:hypothetical protein BC829DRAFT_389283 [Chytridium lagenaria]|nr:hypothetical protein BC829DRAFT_389283 [Chytridium lagenaria]